MENKKKKESKSIKKTSTTKKVKTTKIPVKKKTTRKKPKKKAFTLIELLAVIIILGVLMIIAVPSVTSYINNSRKSGYVTTAKNLMDGARTKVNEGKLSIYDTGKTYYLPFSMIKTENAAKSPYGEFTEAYVVVTYDGDGFDYYWTSTDETKTGVYLTYYSELDNDKIVSNVSAGLTDIAICGKEEIVVFKEDGTQETKVADDCIEPKGSYEGNVLENTNATASGFFTFDKSTGTIKGVHDDISLTLLDIDACATYLYEDGWSNSLEEANDYCNNGLLNEIINYNEIDFARELQDRNILKINSIKNCPKDVVIPSKIDGVKVVAIDENAFTNNNIYSVEIPKSITTISKYAFDIYYGPYNIINKTGKAFVWTYYSDNAVKTGDVFGGYENVKALIKVTSSKMETIDIDNMFEITNNEATVTLKNKNGYDIYYYPDSNDATRIEVMNVNQSVSVQNCGTVTIRIEKNGEVLFQRPLAFSKCLQ
ncbi:MAG: prepilin-type N-terminal cleavage/methylation domain-containing protein [Bacilli bacterium]|nr:prepilin-type N-terminal cleavage/methylation domain-containing protein [Bacilli bacterium]